MTKTAFFLTALLAAVSAHAEQYKFARPGNVRIDGTVRAATFRTACTPDRDGGALSIELVVPEANTRKDFDYDDFEGPDAVAGEKVPARVAWSSAAGAVEIAHAAGGWYAAEPPDAFVFGISQLSRRREAPAKLMGAATAAGTLEWIQAGFDRPMRRLVATFVFDAAAAGRLHAAVAPCLPAAARSSGRGP